MAQKYGMSYFECSAKSGDQVKEAVECVTKEIMAKYASKPFPKSTSTKIDGNSSAIDKEKKKGYVAYIAAVNIKMQIMI